MAHRTRQRKCLHCRLKQRRNNRKHPDTKKGFKSVCKRITNIVWSIHYSKQVIWVRCVLAVIISFGGHSPAALAALLVDLWLSGNLLLALVKIVLLVISLYLASKAPIMIHGASHISTPQRHLVNTSIPL